MKLFFRRIVSMILAISMFANISLTGFAEAAEVERRSAGEVFTFAQELTWAQAGKQIAGMLGYIVDDAANIDLTAHSERIANLSLEDDSIYLAILAEEGYLPEEPARIDPAADITVEEYIRLLEIAFPIAVDSQEAVDSLRGESKLGNIAIFGDALSVTTMLPERVAVAKAQQLSLTAVKATALSLNAGSSVSLNECEIARVHICDTAVREEEKPEEEVEPQVIYLHMDAGSELPEVIVKDADEVIIEGSGGLGVVRVQEAVDALTVRATGSVINETEEPFEVTGPDAQVVELQPGEQVDFVLSKWLVSFVTEGTAVETQEIAPGGMIDFSKAATTLEGKVFTAWYEDADYTKPVSRLSSVNKQTTLYARFVDESEAAVVTFETFGGRELEPMVFAKGEYLLTKPVESLYTSKEGYSFAGWCADEECTIGFGYTDPIEESMTLYAMYASYEKQEQEEPGTVAELELPDGSAAIGLVLPEGMTPAQAEKSFTVEAGTGLEIPEISVRETDEGAELYCKNGFTPGTTFTLTAQNGVRFTGYPEYIDTLTVSVFREQVEVVEFVEGLTYVLWDHVTDYTPVSKTAVEYKTDYALNGTVCNVMEDHSADGTVIPGKLVLDGKVDLRPEQTVVFYDGEIGRNEAPVDAWEGGDLAGYVLFAKIEAVTANEDGTSEVTFSYADPETYIAELDVHTTEEVNIEEQMSDEQIAQVEKAIASQLASNDELKAQMLVAVMTNEETQRMLDEKYGANTYSLASMIPIVYDPKLDIILDINGSTATAGIGVGITVALKAPQGIVATLSPYLYFEEQLTMDVDMNGGFLWLDMSVLFKTKTTVSLQLKATTGDGMDNVLDEAKATLQKIVNADGTATEGLDYQEAADSLMNTMQELIEADLEYQDLFAVTLFKHKHTFYGIITLGINVELVGQAGVVATFGVTVVAEYGQKIGFNYNFKEFKGGSYKENLGSEVTTEIYLIGKIGVRVGIAVTLSITLLHNVTVSITGAIYAYVDLAGMFLYTYALSAGGGNYAGALYLEVGIDAEIELGLEVEILFISKEFNWTLWSARWPLYKKSIGMTMSVVQSDELDEIWEQNMENADGKTTFPLPYLPMKTYDMLTAACTENQLLFENLKDGKVTAQLTLDNIIINGELVSSDDPRTSVIYVGDGVNGRRGVVYADEMAAAAYKVTDYECDVVLTYQNKNKSELIKKHQQVFPFAREFKMATTTVNVDIRLYDWCSHAWGIEGAEWDNAVVYSGSFESTHVLGCPVEPTATGTIDLNAVIAAVQEQYPEIEGAELSWFSPTLNQVNRTVQYSTPRISNMCYMTPESNTIRYDVFSTTNEYDLTYDLFVSRYLGYSGEITYIIESDQPLDDAVFTLRGSDQGETLTFTPVMGDIGLPTPTAAASMGSTAANKPGSTTANKGVNDTSMPGTEATEPGGSSIDQIIENVKQAKGESETNTSSKASISANNSGTGDPTRQSIGATAPSTEATEPGDSSIDQIIENVKQAKGESGTNTSSKASIGTNNYGTSDPTRQSIGATAPSTEATEPGDSSIDQIIENVKQAKGESGTTTPSGADFSNIKPGTSDPTRQSIGVTAPSTEATGQASGGQTAKYRWSLTTKRALFNGSERPIMMSLNGSSAVASGLMVTGREAGSVVILKLENLSRKLTVETGVGIAYWNCLSHKLSELSAITPGSTVTLSVKLKDGYKSLRMYAVPAGVPYTTDGTNVTFTMPSHDVKVTLRGVRSYQANFLYNYKDLGTYRTVDVTEGDTIEKPADPYVKGLTFAGWYDNAECKGEAYDFTKKAEGNVTLYADWRVNVTVDFGGAKGQARYVEDGVSKPIFPGDSGDYRRFTYTTHTLGDNALEYRLPEYDGYDFAGWYLTSNFSGDPVNPAEYVLTGGVTFYARWRQIAIMTYELNYGEEEEPYAMAMEYVGMPLEHIPEKPQREHYNFLGWFWTNDADPEHLIDVDSYLAEGSMTLYAGWKPVEYTVSYVLNGGENNPANPASYNVESGEIVFREPTRKGYTFLGWTATGDGITGMVDRIPAGSSGNVTLTAAWDINTYTISYNLGGGSVDGENPSSYTVESGEITLVSPSRRGYAFLGWTGTDLTELTRNVVIPAGSIGNRSYTANWSSKVSAEDIIQAAMNAIPTEHTMGVKEFTGIEDVKALAERGISTDAICADYLDQLSVSAAQAGDTQEDATGYSYTVKVTVTLTDDSGNKITKNKNVALRVQKNPVTISAEVLYPIGGSYVAYGTALDHVELTNGAAVSGDVTVAGQFRWEDGTIVPVAADNGKLLYKLLFTPTDTAYYCTAEMLLAVNTQIGVKVVMDAPATIEYMGRDLDASQVSFRAVDIDTGVDIAGATLSITGPVLKQSQYTPGNPTVTLERFDSCQLQGISDTNLYAIVNTTATDTVNITRAVPILSGTTGYSADYGKLLKDISLNLFAATLAETSVEGTFAWEKPNTRLGEVGEFNYKVTFTPKDLNCYESVSQEVKVTVNGVPGKVTYIIQATDAPADSQFTISGAMEAMSFAPVEGKTNEWSVTVNRAAFAEESVCPIMLKHSGSSTIETGLTVTGRETEDQVILKLDFIPRKLSVSFTDGLDSWTMLKPEGLDLNAVAPGTPIVISANLLDGCNNLRLSSQPEGLSYTSDGNTVMFTMPTHDVAIVLRGVKNYLLNCLYNYNDMGTYRNVESTEDGSVAKPEDPTIEGLTFAGWYDNPAFAGDPFDFSQKITGNIDLYADWRVNVTVDFGGQKGIAAYYNWGTGMEPPPEVIEPGDGLGGSYELIFPGDTTEKDSFTFSTCRVGEPMLDLVIPRSESHGFFGWYLKPDCSGDEVNLGGYTLTEGVTFYAKWKKNATLEYMWNDGLGHRYDDQVEYVGDLVEKAPYDPARDGYEFTGWYRTPACLEKDRIDLETYLVEGDLTLYAGWKLVDYTITYDLKGGQNDSRNPASYTIEDGDENGKINLYKPTRDGYTFNGWDCDPVGAVKFNDAFDYWIIPDFLVDVSLTARWVRSDYTISYQLNGGTLTTENPNEYTIESGAITLNDPTRKGYEFLGWTGTGLTEATKNVTIPAGSTGDRSYIANWSINTPVADIVTAAKNAISDTLTYSLKADFDNNLNAGAAEFEPKIQAILSADATCADYAGGQLQSEITVDEKKEDGTGYTYTTTVTVSFKDDEGNVVSENKTVTIRLTKAAVTISSVKPVYTVDGKYIPYGTSLKDVKLSDDCQAIGPENELVAGEFTWADETVVPDAAYNGEAIYKVVFTPYESTGGSKVYSTAETTIAVNTQVCVKVTMATWKTSFEYMACQLPAKNFEYTAVDMVTNKKYTNVSVTGAVHQQSSLEPGTVTSKLLSYESMEISGITGNSLYLIDISEAVATFTIEKALSRTFGKVEYSTTVGSDLRDIEINMYANTLYEYSKENPLPGSFSWDTTDTKLNTAGDFEYTLRFTPNDTIHYASSTREITIHVKKIQVDAPTISSVTYNGQLQKPNIPETDYYTVEANNGGTNVGTYDVVLKLKDPANTAWSDNDTNATKTLTFTINKATLKVTGTASVKELGYGQKLKTGHVTSAEKKYQTTATEMISGLTITDVSGRNVTGYWEWDDETYVGKTLNASKAGVSGDNGEGYEVNAKFTMNSGSENYEPVRQTFHVDVIKAVPDISGCTIKVLEGAIYTPDNVTALSPLDDYTPVFANDTRPVNPNDSSLPQVQGTLWWEGAEGNDVRYPDMTTKKASVKFTPSAEFIKNYQAPNKTIDLTFKNFVKVTIEGTYPYLYDTVKKELTSTMVNYWENPGAGSLGIGALAKTNYLTGDRICIFDITVYAYMNGEYKQVLYNQYFNCGPDDNHHSGIYLNELTVEPVGYPSGLYNAYRINLPGNRNSSWRCHDIRIKIGFGKFVKDEKYDTLGHIEMFGTTSSYSLRSAAPAAAMVQEPVTEPTTIPTEPTAIPEPGAIGSVVSIKPVQSAEQYGDYWVIPLEQDQELVEFRWETSESASEYYVYTMDSTGYMELIDRTTENSIWLPAEDYAEGCSTLYVGAVLEDGSVTWGEAMFQLTPFVEPTEETTEPTEETKDPTEETKDPTEETKDPTEETKDPTEETKDPTEETKDPTEETKDPTEETKDPTEETKDPTEETKDPTQETTDPTEETTDPTEETTDPTQETKDPTEETTDPTEETKDPTQETKDPTQETKDPTQETKDPTQETKDPAEETKDPTQETKDPTQETKDPAEETQNPTEETKAPTEPPMVTSIPEPTSQPAPGTPEPILTTQPAEEAA